MATDDQTATRPATDDAAALIAAIEAEFAAFSGRAGVSARNLGTGETIRVNGEAETATASTIKVPILIEVFRQVEAGTIALSDELTYTADQRTPGSGILRDLVPDITLTVENLATLMIILSDNSATNMLIDLVGLESVNATMADLGFLDTRLIRRLDFPDIGQDGRRLAVTTADDLANIMAAIATNAILTPASCDAMLTILRKQHFRALVPRYLPFNPYGTDLRPDDNGLRIANKTGSWIGMKADMSLVEFPAPDGPVRYVVGISFEENADRRLSVENTGDQMIGRVSRLIFEHFGGGVLAEPWAVTATSDEGTTPASAEAAEA